MMTPKQKMILLAPVIGWRLFRAKSLAKKIRKFKDEDRYPESYKNEYVLKRATKFAKLFNIELKVEGFDNVPKNPVVLAPNHASAFDPALIIMALKNPSPSPDDLDHQSVFIAKKELTENKKLKGFLNIMNTFYIDRENPRAALDTLDEMTKFAKDNKKHIVIFPEGTRSQDGNLNEFKGGAFKVAKQAFLPIVPVTINNSLAAADKNRKEKLTVTVTFHPVMKPMTFMTSETKDIAARVQKVVASKWVKPQGARSENEKMV